MLREVQRGERTHETLEWGDARKFPLLAEEGPGYYRLFLVREGRSDLHLAEGVFPAAAAGERVLIFDVPAILGPCQFRLECRAPDGVVYSGLVGRYTIAAPNAPSAAPPDDWHDATLQPGWHPWFEGGHAHPGYFRDALGIVHLRGVVVVARDGSTPIEGACIFELPIRYWAATPVTAIVPAGVDGFAHVHVRDRWVNLEFVRDGVMNFKGTPFTPLALDPIAFRARPPTGSYAVWLTDLGERKAEVIDIVRAVNPALNLEVVLQFDGRAMIAGDLSLSAAEQLAERLAAAGARVKILPPANLVPGPAPAPP